VVGVLKRSGRALNISSWRLVGADDTGEGSDEAEAAEELIVSTIR